MQSPSRARRCLGITGLSATLVAGCFTVGLVAPGSAFAATTGLDITSQFTSNASTANDGTNSSIRINANATGGDGTDVDHVTFFAQELAPTPAANRTQIGASDTAAPYAVEWTPSEAGTYTETAVAYDSNNNVLGTASKTVTVSATASSVHVVAPAEAGTIGVFTGAGTLADGGTIAVSGTRSVGNPQLKVDARIVSSSNGVLGTAGAATSVPAGTSGSSDDQSWNDAVAVPAGSGDVLVEASTAGGGSDEVAQATPYQQVLGGLSTPKDQRTTGGSKVTFVLNATDTQSQPIAGLTVVADVTDHTGGAAATPATQSVTTDGKGDATFDLTAGTNGTSTIVFRTEIDGTTFQPGVDASKTATLNYLDPVPTGVSFKVRPDKTRFATNGTGVGEYDTTHPIVDVCVSDENGAPLPASGTGPANLILSTSRTVDGGSAVDSTPSRSADTTSGYGNCYVVSHDANAGSYGSDDYNAYLETNNTPGQQSDEASDKTTLTWADLGITGADTQGAKGSDVVGSFVVTGADGKPFVGRTINLLVSGGTDASFPAAGQPAGTTTDPNSSTSATCTTTASGTCSYAVTEPANGNGVETVTVTANDNTTDSDQTATGATASESVRFADTAPELTTVQSNYESVLAPGGAYYNTVGEPGTVVVEQVQLFDADGNVLSNVPVTATVDHGFFTPVPDPADYATGVTFDPAAKNGDPVGAVAAGEVTFSGTTDDNGYLTYALGIGRDQAFDDNGEVLATVSMTASGATQKFSPATEVGYTWSTDSDDLMLMDTNTPLNPGAVSLVPAGSSTTLTGLTRSDHDPAGPSFAVHLTDQFGNLVHDDDAAASLSVTGPGSLDATTDAGSYLGADKKTTHVLTNTATSTRAADATVTAQWSANTSVFDDTATGGVNSSGTTSSNDSFTVSEYSVDTSKLDVVEAVSPASIVKTGTTVRDGVTVTDQYQRPVPGLFVTFSRSGPGKVDSGPNQVATNTSGKAAYSFSSSTQGNATVTVGVYDCDTVNDATCSSANPLDQVVRRIGFDGVPKIKVGSRIGAGKVTVSVATRAGASVRLYQRAAGAATFTAVGSAVTAGVTGTASFTPSVKKTTQFRVRVDNLVDSAAGTAKVGDPIEQPRVALSSKTKGYLGIAVVTNPLLKHKIVRIYTVKADGTRVILARVSTGTTGKVFVRVHLTSGKTYTIQALVVGATGYDSRFSTPVLRKVT